MDFKGRYRLFSDSFAEGDAGRSCIKNETGTYMVTHAGRSDPANTAREGA